MNPEPKEKRTPKRYEKREAADFEKDRAAQMRELSAQMRVCSLCRGEHSSKAAHVAHFTPPEGLVPTCKCPGDGLYFTHWPECKEGAT